MMQLEQMERRVADKRSSVIMTRRDKVLSVTMGLQMEIKAEALLMVQLVSKILL